MPDTTKLTPFEKAEVDRKCAKARIILCQSVQEMITTMQELDAMIADSKQGPPTDMYDDDMIADMEEESKQLMRTLSNIAALMDTQGISA